MIAKKEWLLLLPIMAIGLSLEMPHPYSQRNVYLFVVVKNRRELIKGE